MSTVVQIRMTGVNQQGFAIYKLFAPIKFGETRLSPVASTERYSSGLKPYAEQWCKTHEVDHYFNENGAKVYVDLT